MINRSGAYELVFDVIGDKYFLSRLWLEGETDGFYVAKSSIERALLKGGMMPKTHHIPLNKKQM
jgi:hypothetical protein